MFLDKKTLLKTVLTPGLKLTIFRGTGPRPHITSHNNATSFPGFSPGRGWQDRYFPIPRRFRFSWKHTSAREKNICIRERSTIQCSLHAPIFPCISIHSSSVVLCRCCQSIWRGLARNKRRFHAVFSLKWVQKELSVLAFQRWKKSAVFQFLGQSLLWSVVFLLDQKWKLLGL